MNFAGELLLSRAQIARMAEELRLGEARPSLATDLWRASRVLERRLRGLEALIMDIRMVPLERQFEKLARIVRRVSRDIGKDIRFVTRGGETKLDKVIVEDLADPLMHIIRNSIDHGIESPDDRSANGKEAVGTISLSAEQKGNHVILSVQDDGAGIDPDRVLASATDKGLVEPGTRLSRPEILDLLFAPGFSTRDEASELSGRGVGMDVVKQNLGDLQGTVQIETELGQGTRIVLVLPMTLAMIQVLVVGDGGRSYAIPLNSIEENFGLDESLIHRVEGREVVELRGETLPVVRLGTVFAREERPHRPVGDVPGWIVVIGIGPERAALIVDTLEGQQDVVTKDIGPLLRGLRGVAGAADLGGGETILVLDVIALVEKGLKRRTRAA